MATRFRQWATQHIREYIVKGFVLDDERLKIRTSRSTISTNCYAAFRIFAPQKSGFIQKVIEIYATSADYDPAADMSIEFFKTVQNKMHWAVTGKTAAEIISERCDSNKPNMGLTSWRGVKVRKQDVAIAKNYLTEEELLALNNLVEQYLVFAEGQAMKRIPMYMKDWIAKLHGFLALNDREILTHAGHISHEIAKAKAEHEYELFKVKRSNADNKAVEQLEQAVKRLPRKTTASKK